MENSNITTEPEKEKLTISPNIDGLKDLACFNVDCGFIQQYGSRLFNYSGEITDEYYRLCTELSTVLKNATKDIENLSKEIPTQNIEKNDSK